MIKTLDPGYERGACSTCHGSFTVPCEECKGHGTIACRCECGNIHGVRCKPCNGSGAFHCSDCAPEFVKGKPLVLRSDIEAPL